MAIMLCGPAKTAALGVSLVSSQYGSNNPNLGILLVPLVLYQAEQVMTANFLTGIMKKWIHYDDEKKNESDDENQLSHRNTREEDEEISQEEEELQREENNLTEGTEETEQTSSSGSREVESFSMHSQPIKA